jgi:hypothetical protein
MVVDHIQDRAQALFVAGVDQTLQAFRTTVDVVRGIEIDAVIAPSARPTELGDRHDLNVTYPKLNQVRQFLNRGLKGSLRRKRADVDLVNHRR